MLKSFLNGINDLIGSEGFREQEVYSIYGAPSVGKSVYLIGEAMNFLKNGWRVVWLDTEGGFHGNWGNWSPVYEKRFDVSFSKFADNFFYQRVLSFEEFCALFGMQVEVVYGESKMEITVKKGFDEKDSAIYDKFGRMKGKMLVVVDSFSSPIKLQFTSKVQNFSARADAESLMLFNVIRFMEKVNATVLLSNHESKNPTDIYHQTAKLRGGDTLKYYSKYICHIEKPLKKAWQNYRHITAIRTPIAPDNTLARWLSLSDTGYTDVSESDVENTK